MGFDIAPYGEAIAQGSKLLNSILSRVLPAEKMSEAERTKLSQDLTLALMEKDSQQVMAELGINEAEAKSDSILVAGWRAAVGWVCAAAFGYTFVLQPFAVFWITIFAWQTPPLPALDMGPLMAVLGGILGIG